MPDPVPPAAGTGPAPPDDPLRRSLHDEVHARPTARIRLPALLIYVAVLNDGISREAECAHLRELPGQGELSIEALRGGFLRLRLGGWTLKWERHTEFSRYTLVQPLPDGAELGRDQPDLLEGLVVTTDWLRRIPGRTIAAIEMAMVHGDPAATPELVAQAQAWFGPTNLLASRLGNQGHSLAFTDFLLRPTGFERMLVVAPPGTSELRAGRASQRLIEMETYRLMALRGLPDAKALAPGLADMERELSGITERLERKAESDQELLDTLVSLAAGVERATAAHVFRFSATRAYESLVDQRIGELREQPVSGIQTLGEFMRRRLSPAMSTVRATAQRLDSLSQRVARASDLLRTRVDIATETHNRELLEKLTRGQQLQLRLQSTVEGLSIAAISYYVVSLLLYAAKALKVAGLPVHPELLVGSAIPLILWLVWRTIRRIHESLHADGPH